MRYWKKKIVGRCFFSLPICARVFLGGTKCRPDADVLEIGAGFGALTGILCEKAAPVTVTERALFRARAITKRYADYTNLDVYAGDLRIFILSVNMTSLF